MLLEVVASMLIITAPLPAFAKSIAGLGIAGIATACRN